MTKQSKICIWEGCNRKTIAKSLCTKHYSRFKRGYEINGNSIGDRRIGHIESDYYKIPIGLNAKDGYTLVDMEDSYLEEYKWRLDNKGYVVGNIHGKNIFISHAILGKPRDGYVVDHKNRTPKDNRRKNLRFATMRENVVNSYVARGTSDYKGVHKDKNTYRVNIMYKSKIYNIGNFADEIEAALAYDCAAIQLHGDVAYTNILGKTL